MAFKWRTLGFESPPTSGSWVDASNEIPIFRIPSIGEMSGDGINVVCFGGSDEPHVLLNAAMEFKSAMQDRLNGKPLGLVRYFVSNDEHFNCCAPREVPRPFDWLLPFSSPIQPRQSKVYPAVRPLRNIFLTGVVRWRRPQRGFRLRCQCERLRILMPQAVPLASS